jgi:hypothetical protein
MATLPFNDITTPSISDNENWYDFCPTRGGMVERLQHGADVFVVVDHRELAVGHRAEIDKEAIDIHPMRRRLLRVTGIGAHPELARLDPHHVASTMREQTRFRLLTRRLPGPGPSHSRTE